MKVSLGLSGTWFTFRITAIWKLVYFRDPDEFAYLKGLSEQAVHGAVPGLLIGLHPHDLIAHDAGRVVTIVIPG